MPILPYPERLRERLTVRKIEDLMMVDSGDFVVNYEALIEIIGVIEDFEAYLRERDAVRDAAQAKKTFNRARPPKPAYKHFGKGR